MADNHSPLWADQAFLRDVQYRDDANLAARQSIYAYAEPKRDLIGQVIASLDLTGNEMIVDVGCGNGRYLAGLAALGHRGPALGMDMSPGMLAVARRAAPVAALACADACALPVRPGVTDLAFAMHMLYHVPEPELAVAELRRITRSGGQVVVALNGSDHLRELRTLVGVELAAAGHAASDVAIEPITLDDGEALLGREFSSVVRHDLTGILRIPRPEPLLEYVRSMSLLRSAPDAGRLARAIADRLEFEPDGHLTLTTHAGWLTCT